MILETTWSEVKRLSNQKPVPLQWVEKDGRFIVYAVDGSFNVHCTLTPETEDYEDFDANYKTSVARRVASSQSALANPEDYRFRGTSTHWTTASAGQATNKDIVLSENEDRWVSGGVLLVDNAARGDWVSFSVLHPQYGVVEVYVPSWTVLPGVNKDPITVYPARVPAGCSLRLTYNSVGNSDAFFACNYYVHRRGIGS